MASLSRAYGVRGAAIALGMATVAGAVHGTMAASFDLLWLKVVVGLAGSVVLIMAGAISARRSILSAAALGLGMAFCFLVARWGAWATILDGSSGLIDFLAIPPWEWPGYLAAGGISSFWVVEAISISVPALIGALVGREHKELPIS